MDSISAVERNNIVTHQYITIRGDICNSGGVTNHRVVFNSVAGANVINT